MKYVIVNWPESQDLMNEDWFDECFLINDKLEEVGLCAYFVSENRYEELLNNLIETNS